MEKHWKFLHHIKIAYNLMVCYNLDPRSFVQIQDHCKKFLLRPYLIMEND